jgi:hypothetical protein
MSTRTTPGEGDYNLSHPINNFVDVARRVVLQPVRFFAGLPRDRNFVSPLLFALICTEISIILGWLLVISGVGSSPGFNPNPQNAGLPSVVAPGSSVVSILLAPRGVGVELWFSGNLPGSFLHAGYQPGELDTARRSPAGSVRRLPVHRWHKRDARDNDGEGRAGRTDTVRCGPLGGIAGPPCGRGGVLQPKVAEGGF